jgi:hypothetical protein
MSAARVTVLKKVSKYSTRVSTDVENERGS